MSRLLKILVLVLASAGVLVLAGLWQADRWLEEPLEVPPAGLEFSIPPGTAMQTVSNRLADLGVLQHPAMLTGYARITGKASQIHAGEYRLEPGLTSYQLLEKFIRGDVRLYSFTIVEGWNFRELLQAMAGDPALQQTLTSADLPELLQALGAEWAHPEGLFLPETYRFPKGTTDRQLLAQAYRLLRETLMDVWAGRAEGLPLESPYEALILASIIEKETARADERARIAGVFVRRLQQGMRLQTDPTVIYGVGPSFDGNLTRRHLRTDTAYNTYTRRGLPPTPIALAGRAAIHAALHPAEGDEIFFVATGLGDGSHKFSVTIEQHEAAVREYLARQRANKAGQKP